MKRTHFSSLSEAIKKSHELSFLLMAVVYVYIAEDGTFFLDMRGDRSEEIQGFTNLNLYTDMTIKV